MTMSKKNSRANGCPVGARSSSVAAQGQQQQRQSAASASSVTGSATGSGTATATETGTVSRRRSTMSDRRLVTLNVSGCKFQTFASTLERYPATLLGDRRRRAAYLIDENEYFFDRHRGCFESILYFYQSGGQLRRPAHVPVDVFARELAHFEMGQEAMRAFWAGEGYVEPKRRPQPNNALQRRLWQLVEQPDTSRAARMVAFLSVFVIVLSTLSFCLETIPELKLWSTTTTYTRIAAQQQHKNSTTTLLTIVANASGAPSDVAAAGEQDDNKFDVTNPFFVVEFSCMCWFTLELAVRFGSCPQKVHFCKSFLNIIDFVAIVPFFLNLALSYLGSSSGGASTSSTAGSSTMSFAVLRVFRLVRVFRVFKLSRHSRGLQILGKTFKASVQELMLLMFFMMIGLVLFSSGMYFAESGIEGSKFDSIPAAFWFSIVSMTTVGYGDLVPVGVYGKIVGSMCAIVGVLVLALPVPVIVANFKHFYRQEARLTHMRLLEEAEDSSSTQAAVVDDSDEDDSRSE